jgi:hypothetical protein
MDRPDYLSDEFVDELLQPADTSPIPELRGEVFKGTVRVIRHRRQLARLKWVVSLAACYVAGISTAILLRQFRPATESAQVQALASSPPESMDGIAAIGEGPAEGATVPPLEEKLPAAVLEKLAEFGTHDQFRELNRRAGDLYLVDLQDLSAALRCYRRVLDSATISELAISDSDNWLMMNLKHARLKELQRENHDG